MSAGDFQAFVLFLLVFQCLDVYTSTGTVQLQCHLGENCNDLTSCNLTNTTCGVDEFCYALWKNDTGNLDVQRQGCWKRIDENCSRTTCMFGIRANNGFYFCCCDTDLCNANNKLGIDNEVTTSAATSSQSPRINTSTSTPSPTAGKGIPWNILLLCVLPIFGISVISIVGVFMYYRHRTSLSSPVSEEEPLHTMPPPSPDLGIKPIQLVEVISQGQFGTVWKANFLQDVVAVKILPASYKATWACEKEIYTACNVKHESILNFLAAEKHLDGQCVEFWLVTQFHENGSLADYLKKCVVNWPELCGMAGSMASGLSYLHTEFHGAHFKPCIAHRDFKSKNVLVKKDLTCCLSDFGLAAKFHSGGDPGETHGQVGTKRYMAPEVLEGAINFTRESFLYIDVYAFALVLWEVASRCSAVDGPVEEYRLPFEEEVGSHPSTEDMQQAVVLKKMRPKFRIDWYSHLGMKTLLQTIEECWDQDAEARLTAQCVLERMMQLQTTFLPGSDQLPAVTTFVNDTSITISSRESAM
ncbi:activin receptor type-2B-like [Montipora foliosa]|uniref:activin receptor type-2B-like n=1 Tax=Montipora foliosa TaxID=591990 RepID=UPI0035F0FFA3